MDSREARRHLQRCIEFFMNTPRERFRRGRDVDAALRMCGELERIISRLSSGSPRGDGVNDE
jgi:hypothetical protein